MLLCKEIEAVEKLDTPFAHKTVDSKLKSEILQMLWKLTITDLYY